MTKNNDKRANVLEVYETKGEGNNPIEGKVFLEISNRKLECFLDIGELGKFKKNKAAFVELELLTLDTYPNEKKEKKIMLVPGWGFPKVNQYKLFGEILKLRPHERHETEYSAVIDCGLYIPIQIRKQKKPKVGEYIIAEGRLDAFFIRGISND